MYDRSVYNEPCADSWCRKRLLEKAAPYILDLLLNRYSGFAQLRNGMSINSRYRATLWIFRLVEKAQDC